MRRILSLWLTYAACASAGDWLGFRGPNGSGIASGPAPPVEFGPHSNIVWKTAIPRGSSSPILAGDRVFLTAFEGDDLLTICLERSTGIVLWRQAIRRPRAEALHVLNNPASPTPVSDGSNVYAFFGDFGLVAYDGGGRERWRLAMGPFVNLHGMAGSPMLADGKLILACDQDTGAYLLAVDKETGRIAWKTARSEVVHGFTTPILFERPGQPPQIIVPGSYQVTGYSLATGERIWWVRGVTWQMKTSAVAAGGAIYVAGWAPGADAGERAELPPFAEVLREGDKNKDGKLAPEEIPERWRHRGSWNAIDLNRDGYWDERDWSFYRARRASRNVTLAIRPGSASGDLTATHVLWEYEKSVPQVSSPLMLSGLLYTIKDGGILTAIDAETGAVRKQGRVPGAVDNYFASPTAVDGKLYLMSENGKASVLKAGPDWEVLAVNDMEEPCYASPVIADGRLYLRTATSLYCFAAKKMGE